MQSKGLLGIVCPSLCQQFIRKPLDKIIISGGGVKPHKSPLDPPLRGILTKKVGALQPLDEENNIIV